MSKLIGIINDPFSTVLLECTKGHIVKKPEVPGGWKAKEGSYRKGFRSPRNELFIDCTQLHWKIAAKKYQKAQENRINKLKEQYSQTLHKI